MTPRRSAAALALLESLLADTNLQPPRPLADLGLNEAQREHIKQSFQVNEASMRKAAVLIAIQPNGNEADIILTQRAENLRHHPGQISFPGGSQELHDRDLAHTALREAEEEIALDPAMVKVLGFLPDYPTISGFRVTPVVGLVENQAEIYADEQEVSAIHRLPFSHVLCAEGFAQKTIEHNGMKLPFFEISHGELRIWGATAGMLFQLSSLLDS